MSFGFIRIGMVGMLLAPYAMVVAQELSTVDLVKGNYGNYATVLKLAELPEGYSAVRLSFSSGSSDPISSVMTMYGLGRQVGGYNGAEKYRVSQCSWTNGDTVRSINKEFLVTYQLDSDVLISSAQAENAVISDSPSRPAGPEPTLKIHLIALDSIQAINPCPEITKQELVSTFGIGRLVGQTPESFAARQSATVSNLKQVALGMIMYTNDYDDAYPYAQSTPAAFFVELPYVKNIQVFKSLNPKGSIIRFNMGISGGLASSIDSPAETVMFYESEAWDDGRRAVAYCDGHVKWVKAEDWATLSTKLKPASLQRVKQALPASYDLEWKKAVAQYAGRKNQG